MNMRLDTRVQEDSIHLPRVIIQFSIIFSPLSSFPISKAQLMDTDETKKNNNEKFLSSCTLHCKINPNLLAKIGNTTLQKCSNYSIICRLLINSKRLLDRREKEGGETVSTGGNLYLLNRKQQLGPRDWMLDPMHFTWRIRSRSIKSSQHPRNREKQQRLIDIPLDIEIVPIIKINTTLSRPCCPPCYYRR